MQNMMEALFWASLVFLVYAYFGYPLLMAIWPFQRAIRRRPFEPAISFVIAVRNEENRVDEKIQHLLELPYPPELREVVIVSDGSTDGTAERLAAWSGIPAVRTLHRTEARGKASALNAAVPQAMGEIIIFNDVRQTLATDAVPLLMENFADPEVGCASGELRFGSEGEEERLNTTLYWKYERWLRRKETLSGSVMGASGAFYAIRKELFRPLPEGLVLDDVYTPLQIALSGRRAIHDERAVFCDSESGSERHEFLRKVRTLSGNYQLLKFLPGLLRPGRIGIQFFSHKLLRLIGPVLLALLLVSSALAGDPLLRLAFWLQLGFYALGTATLILHWRPPSVLKVPGAFLSLNTAAAVALFYFVMGREVQWKR